MPPLGPFPTVPRTACFLAVAVACHAEEPPAVPEPARLATAPAFAAPPSPTASAVAPNPSSKSLPDLTPIPLDRFEDGARHYRNANGISEYPRYLPEQYVAIAENILLHQRD